VPAKHRVLRVKRKEARDVFLMIRYDRRRKGEQVTEKGGRKVEAKEKSGRIGLVSRSGYNNTEGNSVVKHRGRRRIRGVKS